MKKQIKKIFKIIALIMYLIFFVYWTGTLLGLEFATDFAYFLYKHRISYSGKVVKIFYNSENRNTLSVMLQNGTEYHTWSISDISSDCQKMIQLGDSIIKNKGEAGIHIINSEKKRFCPSVLGGGSVHRKTESLID